MESISRKQTWTARWSPSQEGNGRFYRNLKLDANEIRSSGVAHRQNVRCCPFAVAAGWFSMRYADLNLAAGHKSISCWQSMKLSIVGLGRVGSAIAFATTIEPNVREMLLINRSIRKAEGDAMDLTHAAALRNSSVKISAGGIADSGGSDIIVYTPSVSPDREDWKRSDLAKGNWAIAAEWLPQLAAASPDAILIMVSNPVDALTYAAIELTGFESHRVIGTGTLVDSIRYRALLSEQLEIHPDDIRAYILGEHGDNQFAAQSIAMTGGEHVDNTESTQAAFERTVRMGYEVYDRKGYTNHAIALATTTIIDSIVYDLRHTMPISVLVDGYLEIRDVCLSLPAVIGRKGVTKILHPPLSPDEQLAFRRSADSVRATIGQMRRSSDTRAL